MGQSGISQTICADPHGESAGFFAGITEDLTKRVGIKIRLLAGFFSGLVFLWLFDITAMRFGLGGDLMRGSITRGSWCCFWPLVLRGSSMRTTSSMALMA